MATGGMTKAQGRRSSKNKNYYKSLPARVKANKDSNVAKAKAVAATPKELSVARGTARRVARAKVDWGRVQDHRANHGRDHTQWRSFL